MRSVVERVAIMLVIALAAVPAQSQTCGQWIPDAPIQGVPEAVRSAVVWDPDQEGPAESVLVVSGAFPVAGAESVPGVAVWDGTRWRGLGNSSIGGGNSLLIVFRGDLHALDSFSVKRWSGVRWDTLATFAGGPLSGDGRRVLSGFANERELLVGGIFDRVNGVPMRGIVRWDGQRWSSVGGGLSWRVTAVTASDTSVYAAGGEGSPFAGGVMEWRDGQWRQLGDAYTRTISSLVIHNGQLWANRQVGPPSAFSAVTFWDGQAWRVPTARVFYWIESLAAIDGQLFACGDVILPDRKRERAAVFLLDGDVWRPILRTEGGVQVAGVTKYLGNLVAFGSIPTLLDRPARHIVQQIGEEWRPIGNGLAHRVNAICTWGDDVAVAGGGYVSSNRGGTWSQVGQRLGSSVNALVEFDGTLYAAGGFGRLWLPPTGYTVTPSLARLNGDTWEAIDPLGAQYMTGLFVDDRRLVAWGGSQDQAIRFFDGTHWSAEAGVARNRTSLGSTSSAEIAQVASYGGRLVVAGRFDEIGDIAAQAAAVWDDGRWHAMDAGLPARVVAHGLAEWQGRLILATSHGMHEWVTDRWAPLSGWAATTGRLTVHNGELFGYSSYRQIYRYDHGAIASLGAGWAPWVGDVESIHGELWVGFTDWDSVRAGTAIGDGRVLGVVARWSNAPLRPSLQAPSQAVRVRRGTPLTLSVPEPAGTGPFYYRWWHNGQPIQSGWGPQGRVTHSGAWSRHLRIDGVRDDAAGHYRIEAIGPCGATFGGPMPVSVTCGADFKADGVAGYDDLIGYLRAWFNGSIYAEQDGIPTLGTGDLFTFLREYLAGCP